MTRRIYSFLVLTLAACAAAVCIAADSPMLTDGEIWNSGVDAYRAGDVTNALRILRPLMLSKTHGPRAAEVVAKIQHDAAMSPEAATDSASMLAKREEAAAAAQIALRANPDDDRAQRNFTRAADRLAEVREAARIDAVLKAAEGRDPGSLLQSGVAEARALFGASAGYLTNDARRVVALGDSLSARARRLTDTWLPVREAICRSVTNEEQAATIIQQIEAAQSRTAAAATAFGDLDGEAYAAMSDVEHDFTRFFKLTVMPPAAMAADLEAQTNAWIDAETVNGRAWQGEALDYTRAFRAKFPMWARAYEQQAQSDTNKPPFTAEDQAKVSALATELEKTQLECVEKNLPPRQAHALDIIRQIQELLPKDQNGGQGQSQQNQQQNKQDRNQQRQNQQDQNQQQQQDQNPQQDQQDQKQDQDPEQQPDDQDREQDQAGEDEKEDSELEAVLKRAQERNDEHEAEKKARMRKAPLPPNERDW